DLEAHAAVFRRVPEQQLERLTGTDRLAQAHSGDLRDPLRPAGEDREALLDERQLGDAGEDRPAGEVAAEGGAVLRDLDLVARAFSRFFPRAEAEAEIRGGAHPVAAAGRFPADSAAGAGTSAASSDQRSLRGAIGMRRCIQAIRRMKRIRQRTPKAGRGKTSPARSEMIARCTASGPWASSSSSRK